MVAAIKQHLTVDPDGNIVIRGTNLTPGTSAEVIVLINPPTTDTPEQTPLEAFRALQASFNLDKAAADKWAAENRELRDWNRPRS
ncbi:MAG TPA: hypothetical protein VFE58_09320 [Tepidisphaeraceae bacterium]|jgi:hypothetical protein|nr:hypothetical protein [Tepidisphaeraceae bacterium]